MIGKSVQTGRRVFPEVHFFAINKSKFVAIDGKSQRSGTRYGRKIGTIGKMGRNLVFKIFYHNNFQYTRKGTVGIRYRQEGRTVGNPTPSTINKSNFSNTLPILI